MRFDLVTLHLVLAIAETRSISRGAAQAHPGIRISLDDLTSAEVQAAVASGCVQSAAPHRPRDGAAFCGCAVPARARG